MQNELTPPAPALPAALSHTAAPLTPPGLTDVAVWLKDEIAETHAAIMGVHRFAAEGKDPLLQLNFMKAAVQMMRTQATAALSLQRLTANKPQTPEKRETAPLENAKTNDRPPGWDFKEISEDDLWEDHQAALARRKAALQKG